MFNHNIKMSGNLIVSIEVLGKSEEPYGRMFTLGRTFWWKHFSPMIGRLTGMKAPEGQEKKEERDEKASNNNNEDSEQSAKAEKDKPQKYE